MYSESRINITYWTCFQCQYRPTSDQINHFELNNYNNLFSNSNSKFKSLMNYKMYCLQTPEANLFAWQYSERSANAHSECGWECVSQSGSESASRRWYCLVIWLYQQWWRWAPYWSCKTECNLKPFPLCVKNLKYRDRVASTDKRLSTKGLLELQIFVWCFTFLTIIKSALKNALRFRLQEMFDFREEDSQHWPTTAL